MRGRRGFITTVALLSLVPSALSQETTSVQVTPAQAAVVAGGTAQFTAVARDANGAAIEGAEFTWLATPFPIAGADETGLVSTMRPGKVYVLAISGSAIGIAVLEIAERPVATLSLRAPGGTSVVEGGTLPLELSAATELGDPVSVPEARWRSERPGVAEVSAGGLVMGRSPGSSTIVAAAEGKTARIEVTVTENRWTSLHVAPVAGPVRAGDVVPVAVELSDGAGNEISGEQVVGLGVVWSVSGSGAQIENDGGFVAERPGSYVVSAAIGDVSGSTAIHVIPRANTRRVERVAHVPLGEGVQGGEIWPIGDALYISTIGGAVYAFDISNPTAPVLTDSIILDARLLNDVSTTADAKIGVISREGASTRRNGIVLFDASDPHHPRVVNEYTEGLTAGTHSAFVYEHYAFVTDDATGSLRIIDFQDPLNPREVTRWGVERDVLRSYQVDFINVTPSRFLHDVHVVDGIAYLAYWRDGLIILDVGNGMKGGSISNPKYVSQFKYNHAELYPADWIAGTHAVFRHGDYVFIGDESYTGLLDLHSRAGFETRGLLHVIDVTDIERPRKVAEYDPVEFGVHNVYAEDDVLYIGAYNGGIRVLDIGGELRGNLREQGRVIGSIHTGSLDGYRPNTALVWSAVPHNGYIYASDINTGLWVARVSSMPVRER